ncbi:MAG: hypothetical protein GY862_39150 [Gammaproteobacteria bacterium]|nr:hypothetical protein [Gammaproteobacteria bacterium]
MQAIELETNIAADGSIRLPGNYKNWFGRHARLILLVPETQATPNKAVYGQKMADKALSKIAAHGGTDISLAPVVKEKRHFQNRSEFRASIPPSKVPSAQLISQMREEDDRF